VRGEFPGVLCVGAPGVGGALNSPFTIVTF
jgi:hypothetical protein